jgi:hypothetical protein
MVFRHFVRAKYGASLMLTTRKTGPVATNFLQIRFFTDEKRKNGKIMSIKSRIFYIINKLQGKAVVFETIKQPLEPAVNDSAKVSTITPMNKRRIPPPPPSERIVLDMAQVMRWRRLEPPMPYRKIARKLGNVGYITVRTNVLAYEAAERAAAVPVKAMKPKPIPPTLHVPALTAVTPSMPVSPPVIPAATRHEPAPAPPPATPNSDWSVGVGFGLGHGTGAQWDAPQAIPPQATYDPPQSREAAGGLAGVDDGGDDWK